MDALTWFKSVFRRALVMTPAPLSADVATELWDDVPLYQVAARLRPPPPPMAARQASPPSTDKPRGPRANPDLVVWGGTKRAAAAKRS
jgi:hypothetical protein